MIPLWFRLQCWALSTQSMPLGTQLLFWRGLPLALAVVDQNVLAERVLAVMTEAGTGHFTMSQPRIPGRPLSSFSANQLRLRRRRPSALRDSPSSWQRSTSSSRQESQCLQCLWWENLAVRTSVQRHRPRRAVRTFQVFPLNREDGSQLLSKSASRVYEVGHVS